MRVLDRMKKLLAVGVIVLFLGLAIAPSINANVSKASIESELVEITTELCGIDGVKPHTVSLSKEDAEEVEKLIDDIERRLDNVETREETVEIFNEAVVELDKYGLLGGLSVEQAQKLVTGKIFDTKIAKIFGRLANGNNFSEGENMNSLVYGFCTSISLAASFMWIPAFFLMRHPILLEMFDEFLITLENILGFWLLYILIPIASIGIIYPTFSPINIFAFMLVGWPRLAEGPLFINGENGKQNFSEDFYGIIVGFTGIKIYNLLGGSNPMIGVAYYSNILQSEE